MLINPFLFQTAPPTTYPAELKAFYKAEGSTADEIAGQNAAAGTSTSYAAGIDGNAFNFNYSADDRVTVPILNLGDSYSLEFYIFKNLVSGSLLVNDYKSAGNFGGLYLDFVGSKNLIYYQNGVTIVSVAGEEIPNNIWAKIGLSYWSGKTRLYVNGKLREIENGTHNETYNNPIGIGYGLLNTERDEPFTGKIDEVKFYSPARLFDANKLYAFYKGENNTNDSGEFSINAQAGTSTAYAAGKDNGVDKSFLFNGSTASAVNVPRFVMEEYSIEFWVYPTSADEYSHIISNQWNAALKFGAIYYRSDRVSYWEGSSERVISPSGSVPLNVWTKVKLTYDGQKSRLYINDALSATEGGTHSEKYESEVKIGFATGASDLAFNGRVDEIKFYNYVL